MSTRLSNRHDRSFLARLLSFDFVSDRVRPGMMGKGFGHRALSLNGRLTPIRLKLQESGQVNKTQFARLQSRFDRLEQHVDRTATKLRQHVSKEITAAHEATADEIAEAKTGIEKEITEVRSEMKKLDFKVNYLLTNPRIERLVQHVKQLQVSVFGRTRV